MTKQKPIKAWMVENPHGNEILASIRGNKKQVWANLKRSILKDKRQILDKGYRVVEVEIRRKHGKKKK